MSSTGSPRELQNGGADGMAYNRKINNENTIYVEIIYRHLSISINLWLL